MLAKLKERKTIAEGTTEITLSLEGQEFNFKAGQYINLCLASLAHPDQKGTCREFSIASSPSDTGIIRTAIRNSESGFKKTLLTMPLGTGVDVDGPFGLFTIPKRQLDPVVLIAGGIGVTPFMSIVRSATENKSPLKMVLITSNHSVEKSAYRETLRDLEKENPNFVFKENIGHLTPEFIAQSVEGLTNIIYPHTQVLDSISTLDGSSSKIQDSKNLNHSGVGAYYLAGPPKMIHDIREALKAAGVDDDDILAEEFVGYE